MAPARMRAGASMPAPGLSRCAIHSVATKINEASSRWIARRYCETSIRSASPEATGAQAPAHPTSPQEIEEGHQENHADQASEQPMRPFPPVDRLELRK